MDVLSLFHCATALKTMRSRISLFIFASWNLDSAIGQDLPSVYGKLSLTTEPLSATELTAVRNFLIINSILFHQYFVLDFITSISLFQIATKCFAGLRLKTCKSVIPTDDRIYGYDSQYYEITLAKTPQMYCLQCCNLNPKRIDNWDINCAIDAFTAASSNLYGYEFRLGTQQTFGGPSFVSCPLQRSACSYSSDGALIGCSTNDDKHLHGYILDLNIIRYTSNFMSWRGISSCQATTIESNVSLTIGDIFTESIRMNWSEAPFQIFQPLNLIFFSLFGIVVIYITLFFGRKKRCPICQKKVTIFINRCSVCVFLGAEVPDPLLLRALDLKGRGIIDGNKPAVSSAQPENYSLLNSFQQCFKFTRSLISCPMESSDMFNFSREKEGIFTVSDKKHKVKKNLRKFEDIELNELEEPSLGHDIVKKIPLNKDMSILSANIAVNRNQNIDDNIIHRNIKVKSPSSKLGSLHKSFIFDNAAALGKEIVTDNDINRKTPFATGCSPEIKIIESQGRNVLISKLNSSVKNARILPYSEETIVRAVDEEFINWKSTGLSRKKF